MTVYLAPRIQEVFEASHGLSDTVHKRNQAWHPAFQEGSEKNTDYPTRSAASA
jgi:hypothetical protein